jgi:hypothetical protein
MDQNNEQHTKLHIYKYVAEHCFTRKKLVPGNIKYLMYTCKVLYSLKLSSEEYQFTWQASWLATTLLIIVFVVMSKRALQPAQSPCSQGLFHEQIVKY